jgi:hypothetical protein
LWHIVCICALVPPYSNVGCYGTHVVYCTDVIHWVVLPYSVAGAAVDYSGSVNGMSGVFGCVRELIAAYDNMLDVVYT